MKNFKPVEEDYIVKDEAGNTVPAYEINEENEKKKAVKTSSGYTVFAAILYALTFVPIAAITLVLALKTRELMPYYGIWPFIGTIVVGVLALIFYLCVLLIARSHSKKSVMTQTAKLAFAYTVLTTVFSLAITYAFPDAISWATQNTIHGEDVLYNGEKMVEQNAKLERDYIMYNILNGNLGGELSYHDLAAHEEDAYGAIIGYNVPEIEASVEKYSALSIAKLNATISTLQTTDPRKYEMYELVYKQYVLNDFDYAFLGDFSEADNIDVRQRQALALAIVDYEYKHSRYLEIVERGFTNNAKDPDPELNAIFNRNYNNFNNDGYLTFDDEHLLLAQVEGRMTIPVVVHLILDDTYQYTQPSWDDSDNIIYQEENNFLYELYDPETFEKTVGPLALAAGFDLDDPDDRKEFLKDEDHEVFTEQDEEGNYFLYSEEGWRVFPNGKVHRPMKWVVLDMLGEGMALTTIDLASSDIGAIVATVLGAMPDIVDAVGGLLTEDLAKVLNAATHGASLGIGLCINDQGGLEINIVSNNVKYGMLGYMHATWVSSDHLLMAVYNVVSVRNWFAIFGALGVLLVVAAGVLRDCAKKVRQDGYKAIDRLNRRKAGKHKAEEGEEPAPEEGAEAAPVAEEPAK